MKDQEITRPAFHILQVQLLYLVRCSKTQYSFIVIVMLLSVPDFAFCFTFKRNAIEAVNETFPDFVFQKNTFSPTPTRLVAGVLHNR